jgi:hypothetical protein
VADRLVTGISHFHYKNGKIVDDWTAYAEQSLLVQIKLGQIVGQEQNSAQPRSPCRFQRLVSNGATS